MQTVTIASMEEISSLLVQAEADIQAFNEKTLVTSSALQEGEQLKLICKIAPVLIALLKVAKVFVGRREKEAIEVTIAALEVACPRG